VSLLILPAVINLRDNDGARYAIAGGALVILAIAIAFSKRKTVAMDQGLAPTVDTAPTEVAEAAEAAPAPVKRAPAKKKAATAKKATVAKNAPAKKAPAKKAPAKKVAARR
jgi:hypothetical protein